MSKIETVVYSCDKCGADIPEGTRRALHFQKDTSKILEPKTWGSVSHKRYDLCESCFSKFMVWFRG